MICLKKMANMLHINRRTYSAYETGANEWLVYILVEIAKLFNTTADYLLSLIDWVRILKDKIKMESNNLDKCFIILNRFLENYHNQAKSVF